MVPKNSFTSIQPLGIGFVAVLFDLLVRSWSEHLLGHANRDGPSLSAASERVQPVRVSRSSVSSGKCAFRRSIKLPDLVIGHWFEPCEGGVVVLDFRVRLVYAADRE